MAKYNIYKIKDGRVSDLQKHLEIKRYELVSTQTSGGYDIHAYFQGPENANMWWLEQYGKAFFKGYAKVHNKIYSGAIIANNDSGAYILPFGKTHFYIQEFVEYNFGLEIAERISDPGNVKMKSLKKFGGRTSKSLTSYSAGSILNFSGGESAEYLKLKPADTSEWGKSFIHFGTSVQFGSIDVDPKEITILLKKLEQAQKKTKNFPIPSVREVKDEAKRNSLYRGLGEKILNDGANVEVVDYEIYGADFIFSQQTHARLKYKRHTSKILTDLKIADIKDFIQSTGDINIETELPKIKVQIIVDGQSKYTVPLLNIIEYYSSEKEFLYKGKWFAPNESFVQQLHRSLNNIPLNAFGEDFSEQEFSDWQSNNEGGVKYRERFIIEKLHSAHAWDIYDREMEYIPSGNNKKYPIEVGDLYDETQKKMYIVKIGAPKDFSYAFDQAAAVLHKLENNQFTTADNRSIEIKNIALLLVFKTERNLQNITDTKSIIFEIKLGDLQNLAIEKNVGIEVLTSNII